MRSTLDIVEEVQCGRPASLEELRLVTRVMAEAAYRERNALEALADAVLQRRPNAMGLAHRGKAVLESTYQARTADPREALARRAPTRT